MADALTTARVCHDVFPTSTERVKGAFTNPTAAVSIRGKYWKNGQTIKVSFEDYLRDEGKALQIKVRKYVDYAFSLTGLKQEWVPAGQGDIRISFIRGGSWSYLGTDNLLIKSGHTLQLGWLDKNSSEAEIGRVTVHEVFHAFGIAHEQQHPHVKIPWDKPKVYDYYRRTQGWSKEQVDNNIFDVYTADEVDFTEYDPDSLMQYPVPNELTIGNFEIGLNTKPSELDIAQLQAIYPKADDTKDKLLKRKALLEGRLDATVAKMKKLVERINFLRRRHYALNKQRKSLKERLDRVNKQLQNY